MPAQATDPLGRFASNTIHHLIATDPAFQLDLEHYFCDLIICHNSHPEERTLHLVKSIIRRFALCCGHKDGVPPPRDPINAYKAIKEARANDAMAATQIRHFIKVKKDVSEILGETGSLTEDTERIVTKNLIEGMAKDGDYLDEVNDVVTMRHGTDRPDGRCKRCDEFRRLATEDNGEEDKSEDDSENGSEEGDNEDKLTTMEKTLALILEKQNQLLEEKEQPKLLIDENEPLDEEAKYKLDTVEFTRLLERREKLVKNLTNRLQEQDKMVEDLTNRLEEQDKLVEDQSNRLKERGDHIEELSNRLKEQDSLLKDAVFTDE